MLDQKTLQAAADMLFAVADASEDQDKAFYYTNAGIRVLNMMDNPADMTQMEWAAG